MALKVAFDSLTGAGELQDPRRFSQRRLIASRPEQPQAPILDLDYVCAKI